MVDVSWSPSANRPRFSPSTCRTVSLQSAFPLYPLCEIAAPRLSKPATFAMTLTVNGCPSGAGIGRGMDIWPKVSRSLPMSSHERPVMSKSTDSGPNSFHSGLAVMLGNSPLATATAVDRAFTPAATMRCSPSFHQPSSMLGESGIMNVLICRPSIS